MNLWAWWVKNFTLNFSCWWSFKFHVCGVVRVAQTDLVTVAAARGCGPPTLPKLSVLRRCQGCCRTTASYPRLATKSWPCPCLCPCSWCLMWFVMTNFWWACGTLMQPPWCIYIYIYKKLSMILEMPPLAAGWQAASLYKHYRVLQRACARANAHDVLM